jgi:hypothetical protein
MITYLCISFFSERFHHAQYLVIIIHRYFGCKGLFGEFTKLLSGNGNDQDELPHYSHFYSSFCYQIVLRIQRGLSNVLKHKACYKLVCIYCSFGTSN